MKAIIELGRRGSVFDSARLQLVASRRGVGPDYLLSFESARTLFAELTPARIDLLDTLRRLGTSSIRALAQAADRNYSNVHADVARLEALGLVERTDKGKFCVPFESVEIRFPLAHPA